jgi:hypothetical protein
MPDDRIILPNKVYTSDNSKTIYLTRPGNYYLSGNFSKTGNGVVFQVRLPKYGESTYDDYKAVYNYIQNTYGLTAKFDYFGNIYTDPASAPSYAQPLFIQANNSDMGLGSTGTTDVLNPDFYFRTSFDIAGGNVTNFRFLGNKPGVNLYINGSFEVGGNVTVNDLDTNERTNNTNNNTLLSKPGAFRIYANGTSLKGTTSGGNPKVNAILCAPKLVFNGNPTLYGAAWTSDLTAGSIEVNAASSQFKYDTSLMTSASFSNADFLPKLLHIVISNQR